MDNIPTYVFDLPDREMWDELCFGVCWKGIVQVGFYTLGAFMVDDMATDVSPFAVMFTAPEVVGLGGKGKHETDRTTVFGTNARKLHQLDRNAITQSLQ